MCELGALEKFWGWIVFVFVCLQVLFLLVVFGDLERDEE
jgi:hypothetical protein